MICPTTPDRFMPRVAEIVARDGNGFALNLVGPARVIAIAGDRERQVCGFRDV